MSDPRLILIGSAIAILIVVASFALIPDPAPLAQELPQPVTLADGSTFIPENSGAGPTMREIKAFVLFDGRVCLNVIDYKAHKVLGLNCRRVTQ